MESCAEGFALSMINAGFKVLTKSERTGEKKATTARLPASVQRGIASLYRSLGGVTNAEVFTAGRWDIACSNGFYVEFDEELHFNRYRRTTLVSPISSALPWTVDYCNFSGHLEELCHRAGVYGRKWSNRSADAMFGGSDAPGVFADKGSSRWKQRALYDAVRDAYAAHTPGVSLVRVSIHDRIGMQDMKSLSKVGQTIDPTNLRKFLQQRRVGPVG